MCYTINLTYACNHAKDFTNHCDRRNWLANVLGHDVLRDVTACQSFWESGLSVPFTCFQCSKTGNVGPNVDEFLASQPDFETISPPLAERFALFWRDILSRNHVQQLQFRTGNELE